MPLLLTTTRSQTIAPCHRYSINYNYTGGVPNYAVCDAGCCDFGCASGGQDLFGGRSSQQYTAELAALGLAVVPGIYGGSGNQACCWHSILHSP